jgi:hypothetical protein
MGTKKKPEVDLEGRLWKDIVSLLKEVTPFRPPPEIEPETALESDLDLSSVMRRALKHNWNEMIDHYETGRQTLVYAGAETLETAGTVWFRIAPK